MKNNGLSRNELLYIFMAGRSGFGRIAGGQSQNNAAREI
jgi:hypothetical protein